MGRSPLLEGLIDYAGVFPPASLDLTAAVAEYQSVRAGEHGWVVGPMLVLASTLDDPVLAEVDQVGAVADVVPDRPVVQAEARVTAATVRDRVLPLLDVAPVVYVESEDPSRIAFLGGVAALRDEGLDVRAKLRTGGATATAFPSPTLVASFLSACAEESIPCKATAGLHHPFRTSSHVPEATEHGFLNVLAAVRCALVDDEEAAVAALSSTDPGEFDVATATWRGVGSSIDVAAVRALFRSIGSCSVDEPTGYLAELGLL